MKWLIDMGVVFVVGKITLDLLPNNQEFAFGLGAVAIFYFISMAGEIWSVMFNGEDE